MQEVENQAIESDVVVTSEPIVETESNEEVETEAETKEVEAEDVAEESKDEGQEVDDDGDEPFPKKAERALERRNKKINKLRSHNAELERKLAAYESQKREQTFDKPTPEGLSEPQEEDFEDYATYLEAKGEYKAERKHAEKEAEALQHKEFESQQQWVQQRASSIDEAAAKLTETIPELDGLYRENQDIIEGYSNETKTAFLEAGSGSVMAFLALATEGRLEELDAMTPTKIAREIALAEIRGEKLSKQRPVSKAPAPIKRPRGSGTKSRKLDDMSPNELINYLKKQK